MLPSFEKTKETGRAFVEVALRSKGGNPVYVKINSIKLPDGKLLVYCENITEQKKAEEDLRQKFEVLERVGESVGAGLAIISKDYDIIWANKTLMALGVASDKKCFQTFNDLDRVCPDCGVKKIFEEKKPIDIHEFKAVDQHGKETWIELRVTPLKDKDGNVTAGLELAVPINERKRDEKALRESQTKFKNLIETTGDFIWEIDTQSRLTYCSPQMEKILGFKPEEMIGKSPFDVILPEDKEKLLRAFSCTTDVANPFNGIETAVKDKFGRVIFVETNGVPFFDEHGTLLGFRGISRDITERKHADEAFRKSEKKYRELADSLPDIVFEADLDGILTFVNERAYEISGYSQEDFEKGLNILLFIDSKEKEKAIKNIQRLSSGCNNIQVEYQFVRKDGTSFPALIMTTAKLSENRVIGFRGLVIDITERKKIEDQLKKNEKHLREIISNAPLE